MKIDDFEKLHQAACEEARALSCRKGHDYSGTVDTLRNLKAPEAYGVVTAEQGVLVRLGDKLSRLWRLTVPAAEAAVKDESVRDTVLDMVNYSLLLLALREDRKERLEDVLDAAGGHDATGT